MSEQRVMEAVRVMEAMEALVQEWAQRAWVRRMIPRQGYWACSCHPNRYRIRSIRSRCIAARLSCSQH